MQIIVVKVIYVKYRKLKRLLLAKKYIIEFVQIAIGCFIMAVSTSLFLLPNQLSTGGFTGIATVIYYIFNIPVGVTVLILNIPLIVIGFFRVGRDFIIKSLVRYSYISFFN